jgi:pimeloyl-ACP methyl ester carboxylesterase
MPYVKSGHSKINYHVIGKGKPLVLVSGLGTDHKTWIFQIPEFQKYFKVIVFDNRGIGKSTGSMGAYSTDLMAEDVKNLIDHLEIDKTHLLGSSMGGMISQKLAIKYPDNIDKLVLCSTSARPYNTITNIIKKALKDIADLSTDEILDSKPRGIIIRKFFDFFLRQVFSKDFIKVNKDIIENILSDYVKNPKYFETFIKQSRAVHKHDALDNVSKIKSETLILTGDSDQLLPHSNSDILAEKIPNSKLVKIPNGNHGMHYELSDTFNEIVLDFLKG